MKKPLLVPASAGPAARSSASDMAPSAGAASSASVRRGPGGILARLLTGMVAAFREGIITTWNLVGSTQVLNLLLLAAVLLAGFMAQRMERIERHLDSVAEAQRITGFAVMKQLQALGLAPHEGKDGDKGGAPAGAAQPAPSPIDPELLEAHPVGSGPAPVVSGTPAPAPTAPTAPAVK